MLGDVKSYHPPAIVSIPQSREAVSLENFCEKSGRQSFRWQATTYAFAVM
jgi:hypothetical protein